MKEGIGDHGEIGKFVDELLELVSGARDRGKEDLAELRDRVQGSAQDAAARADHYAHENPWHVAALAAAIGLAIGVLISRR